MASPKGTQRGNGDDSKSYGPSWRDAMELHRDMEKWSGKRLEIRIAPARGVRGLGGVYVYVRAEDEDWKLWIFGRYDWTGRDHNSSKTLAAALVRALYTWEAEFTSSWTKEELQEKLPLYEVQPD